jgi:surface protein
MNRCIPSRSQNTQDELNTLASGISKLPEAILVTIMESLFVQNVDDSSLAVDVILNSGYFPLINAISLTTNNRMFCFMKTRLWLRILLTMGYNLNDGTFSKKQLLPWHITTIESQRIVIEECQYTSRTHDLIDLFKISKIKEKRIQFFSISKSHTGTEEQLSHVADLLLLKLYENEPDPYGKKFLRGLTKVAKETNESIYKSIGTFFKTMNYDSDDESYFLTLLKGGPPKSVHIRYFDVRKVTSMRCLFKSKLKDIYQDIDLTYWDTSNVIDMSEMFSDNLSYPFSITGMKNWNTCRVKNMSYMFNYFRFHEYNSSISSWCTSSLEDMSGMFYESPWFNQNISSWDTSKVKNMSFLFKGARRFNQSISEWNMDNVKHIIGMFEGAIAFKQSIISGILRLPIIRNNALISRQLLFEIGVNE